MEKHARNSSDAYRASNCSSPQQPELSDTIDTDSEDEERISSSQSLPKVYSVIHAQENVSDLRQKLMEGFYYFADCWHWPEKRFYSDEGKQIS